MKGHEKAVKGIWSKVKERAVKGQGKAVKGIWSKVKERAVKGQGKAVTHQPFDELRVSSGRCLAARRTVSTCWRRLSPVETPAQKPPY